jgi:hypothetical protein
MVPHYVRPLAGRTDRAVPFGSVPLGLPWCCWSISVAPAPPSNWSIAAGVLTALSRAKFLWLQGCRWHFIQSRL